MSLSASGSRHDVVDVDAQGRVDKKVKKEHHDAIHKDEVVEFESLRRLKIEANAYRLVTCDWLSKVKNNGGGN